MNTEDDKKIAIQNAPVIYRASEEYINPEFEGWEMRYYREFIDKSIKDKSDIERVVFNYVTGIQWVYDYYLDGSKDWLWRYEYSYAPLFKDIILYDRCLDIVIEEREGLSELESMEYVIPDIDKNLIPGREVCKNMLEEINIYKWGFCRYLWESHLLLDKL